MMSFKKYVQAILAILLAFSVSSCKDDAEETYLSFKGDLNFSLPKYVKAGEVFTLVPKGLKLDNEDDTYGYYWRVSPTQEALDTTKTEADPRTVSGAFTYEIPDTLCTLKFSLTAFGAEYYSFTVTKSTTILDKDKSLTGIDFSSCDGIFTDPRDNKQYPYSTIGGLDWFCKNLAYEELGMPHQNCPVATDVFGQYYSWEEANEACPEGWRIPTEEDWIKLANAYDSTRVFSSLETFTNIAGHLMSDKVILNGEDESLWEYWTKVNYSNDDNMNVLPFGYGISEDDYYSFDGFSEYAVLWTGTPYEENQAVYRYLFQSKADVYAAVADKKSFMASVRCVRDSEVSEEQSAGR